MRDVIENLLSNKFFLNFLTTDIDNSPYQQCASARMCCHTTWEDYKAKSCALLVISGYTEKNGLQYVIFFSK